MKKHKPLLFSISIAMLLGCVFLIFGAASRGTLSGSPEVQVIQGPDRQGMELMDEEITIQNLTPVENEVTPFESSSPVRKLTQATPKVKQQNSFKQRVAEKILLRKIRKMDKKSKKGGLNSGKSQLVALILCFFIGVLGIHRFYLGYVGIGVIQLLTGGLCGLWTLIDFILILIGSLKPKDGEYGETF